MKKKFFVITFATIFIIGSFAFARYEPSKTFSLSEALGYINVLSTAYLNNVTTRGREGTFTPTDEYYRELRSRLNDLQEFLQQTQEENYIKITNVNTPENKIVLRDALNCVQCKGTTDAAIGKKEPETTRQLKQLLMARTDMLEKMIPKTGTITKDAVIQIDLQMAYLRIIVIAYLSS